ncbi:MAG: hypothetical protein IJX62_04760 [Clostridia bacterium]|nr:hypothetical protein [Clostridia bacterium]
MKKKFTRAVAKIAILLWICLLALTGCNGTNDAIGEGTESESLSSTTGTSDTTESDTTEKAPDSTQLPQGIEVFYADLNKDGVNERIEVNHVLANTAEELTEPSIIVYTERNGETVEVWSFKYSLSSNYKGVMLVGNKIRVWNLVDSDESIRMGVGEVDFDSDLQVSGITPVLAKTLEKINGGISHHGSDAYTMVRGFCEKLDGGTVLISNWDGTITYSTQEQPITRVQIPQWIRELYPDLVE